ncbi:MAG: hypothetical protein SGARI_006443 [Bacillariaceae sp.]
MISSTLGITDEHTTSLVKYGLMAIGAVAILKIISQSLLYYFLLASPFLYGYLKTTCPAQETFDAKVELKTVLGGDHLPDAHPDKPKTKWQQLFHSAKANVTAEYSALVGDITQTEFTDIIGCGMLAKVTSQQRTHYWVGAAHQWRYIGSTPDPPTATTSASSTTETQTPTPEPPASNPRRSSVSASSSSARSSIFSSLTGSMSKKKS